MRCFAVLQLCRRGGLGPGRRPSLAGGACEACNQGAVTALSRHLCNVKPWQATLPRPPPPLCTAGSMATGIYNKALGTSANVSLLLH